MCDTEYKTDHCRIEDAVAAAVIRDFETMPKNECPVPYSAKFLKKMDKLLKRESRFYFKITNTAIKRVAVAVIAVLIISSSMLSIGAVRRAVAGFFTDIYEAFTRLTVAQDQYDGNLKTKIEEVYILDKVPEEYTLVYESYGLCISMLEWKNDSDERITFCQLASSTGSSMIDTEYSEYKEIHTDEFEGLYLINVNDNYHFITWVYNGYIFDLTCPLSISEDDIIRLAKSIKVYTED